MSVQEEAIRAIEAQQAKAAPRSAVWMVGEQLKDICRREVKSAELLAQDLRREDLSLAQAEQKIKAFADKHKTGNFACVTPLEADQILREFYGLPPLETDQILREFYGLPPLETDQIFREFYGPSAPEQTAPPPPPVSWAPVDLADFL